MRASLPQHTASSPTERARVEAHGGSIRTSADGKQRLEGVIEVTRCVGDRPLRRFGLTSAPNVHVEDLGACDKALVLASDGLWDVLSPQDVLRCLSQTAKSPDLLAKRLVQEAIDAKSTDNITATVVLLGNV